jgi:hypothetical protein
MRREDGRTEPESCRQLRAAAWIGKDIVEGGVRWLGEWIERKTAWRGERENDSTASTAIANEKNGKSFGENLGVTWCTLCKHIQSASLEV